MKVWLQQLCQRRRPDSAQQQAQHNRVRALYDAPTALPRDFERPAYLRKARAFPVH